MISATIAITIGLTFYQLEGETLACGGTYNANHGLWMAAPIEWNKDGYVSCGDMAYVTFANGLSITVPIRDFGCHLHYPAYGGNDLPYGGDFPRILGLEKVPTGIGTLAVRRKNGSWWKEPPLLAWGTQWCDGPLTYKEVERWH